MSDELKQLRREKQELTEKCRRLEIELQKSEDRFSKIFHSAPSIMTISRIQDGQIVDLNQASANLGGFKREELIGTSRSGRSLWANPEQRDVVISKLNTEGNIRNLPVDFVGKNGEIHHLLFSAESILFNDEACFLSMSLNITEQQKEAAALRDSEEKYRQLVENSIQGLAILQDTRFVFSNRAFSEISGYTFEELLAFPSSTDLIHPEDRAEAIRRYHARLEGLPVPSNYEYRIIRKDGSIRWLQGFACIIQYRGRTATQIAHIDVTDRREIEQALRESKEYLNHIINCIGDPIAVKDRNYNLILVNDAFCTTLGSSREDLIGTTGFEHLAQEVIQALRQNEEEVFNTGKECLTEDVIFGPDGSASTLMTRKSLLTGKDGKKQLVLVIRDITEYKRLEAQFLQSQKMEAIGVLAGGVAHDFNNLLNVINGYGELLMEDLAPDNPMRKDLGQIQDAGKRAAALTSQLLAFGRKQILQPEDFDINTVITQMNSILSRLIGEDIHLVTNMTPERGLIHADPAKIQQILLNLVVNARDAMPHGGSLTIETANVVFTESAKKEYWETQPGPYVMLSISDTGIGMDAKTQSRMFEPFFTTKPKDQGTGLGLSTVYGIVQQSSGFILVNSKPGEGTTFKIYFPSKGNHNSSVSEERTPQRTLLGSETVLLVEDEAAVRNLTSRILKEKGYQVLEASHGAEALQISREFKEKIHLVITDVVMPGIRGNVLLNRIESERPNIKSLYISGYTDNALAHRGILNSEVAFLQKPFSIENLTHKVRELLDSPVSTNA